MFKDGARITKSRSMIVSLYALSGIAGLMLLGFLSLGLIHIFVQFDLTGLELVKEYLFDSFLLVSLSLVVSLPFAGSVTYILVSRVRTRSFSALQALMNWVGQAPIVLYGLIFLFLLGPGRLGLTLALVFLSMAQLVRRWTQLSSLVPFLEIESMQSMGVQIWQIIYLLYIRRFFKKYLYHMAAVFCYLMVLVTPFLCFSHSGSESQFLISTALYKVLGAEMGVSAGLASIVLLFHATRVWLDHKTSYWEVDFG